MTTTFIAVPVRAIDGTEYQFEVIWRFDKNSSSLEVTYDGEGVVASGHYDGILGFSEVDQEIRRLVTKLFRSWEREYEDAEAFSQTIVLGEARMLNVA